MSHVTVDRTDAIGVAMLQHAGTCPHCTSTIPCADAERMWRRWARCLVVISVTHPDEHRERIARMRRAINAAKACAFCERTATTAARCSACGWAQPMCPAHADAPTNGRTFREHMERLHAAVCAA